jgi:hypothetical protein
MRDAQHEPAESPQPLVRERRQALARLGTGGLDEPDRAIRRPGEVEGELGVVRVLDQLVRERGRVGQQHESARARRGEGGQDVPGAVSQQRQRCTGPRDRRRPARGDLVHAVHLGGAGQRAGNFESRGADLDRRAGKLGKVALVDVAADDQVPTLRDQIAQRGDVGRLQRAGVDQHRRRVRVEIGVGWSGIRPLDCVVRRVEERRPHGQPARPAVVHARRARAGGRGDNGNDAGDERNRQHTSCESPGRAHRRSTSAITLRHPSRASSKSRRPASAPPKTTRW